MELKGYEKLFDTLKKIAIEESARIAEAEAHGKLTEDDRRSQSILTLAVHKAKAKAEAHDDVMCLLNLIFNTLLEIRNK